jgi:hypothetical protein
MGHNQMVVSRWASPPKNRDLVSTRSRRALDPFRRALRPGSIFQPPARPRAASRPSSAMPSSAWLEGNGAHPPTHYPGHNSAVAPSLMSHAETVRRSSSASDT